MNAKTRVPWPLLSLVLGGIIMTTVLVLLHSSHGRSLLGQLESSGCDDTIASWKLLVHVNGNVTGRCEECSSYHGSFTLHKDGQCLWTTAQSAVCPKSEELTDIPAWALLFEEGQYVLYAQEALGVSSDGFGRLALSEGLEQETELSAFQPFPWRDPFGSTKTCQFDEVEIKLWPSEEGGVEQPEVPSVIPMVCGNGLVEEGEECDQGADNGLDTSCCTETCDFRTSGNVCRPESGECDRSEMCTGSSGACPVDLFESSSKVCRTSTSACDAVEYCTGVTPDCPADIVAFAGTVCRRSGGECDIEEICDGESAECPPDAFRTAETICRAAEGRCDKAEHCTGTDARCPRNAYIDEGTICREATGACDIAESCSGFGATCPSDRHAVGNICRPAAGECDEAERCPGTNPDCPDDSFHSTAIMCRATADSSCDKPEHCTGSSVDCPSDDHACSEPIQCGDLACNGEENCETCKKDCGKCPELRIVPFGGTNRRHKVLEEIREVRYTIEGGVPPYTVDISELPLAPPEAPASERITCRVEGHVISCTGILPRNAANPGSALSEDAAQTSAPLSNVRHKPVVRVTDARGQYVQSTFKLDAVALEADLSVAHGCACLHGSINCAIHVRNLGPDIAPELTVELAMQKLKHVRDQMPPKIYADSFGNESLGQGTAAENVWSTRAVAVPVGGKFVAWPKLREIEKNGVRSVSTSMLYSIDPNPHNNVGTYYLTANCKDQTGSLNAERPIEGGQFSHVDGVEVPLCHSDRLLYIIALGAEESTKVVSLTDILDPCLDPETVSGLEPSQHCFRNEDEITCTDIPLPDDEDGIHVTSVSFEVSPWKEGCRLGSMITNKATYSFDDPAQELQASHAVSHRLCTCNDKHQSCWRNLPEREDEEETSDDEDRWQFDTGEQDLADEDDDQEGDETSEDISIDDGQGMADDPVPEQESTPKPHPAPPPLPPHVRTPAEFAVAICGNGKLDFGEECDDGNARSGDGCSMDCRIVDVLRPDPVCGNGIQEGRERCDDGNTVSGDGCSSDCRVEVPERMPEPREITGRICGDGRRDPGEECDDGIGNSDAPRANCRPNCLLNRCGDGRKDLLEECDDGNRMDFDGCSALCTREHLAPPSSPSRDPIPPPKREPIPPPEPTPEPRRTPIPPPAPLPLPPRQTAQVIPISQPLPPPPSPVIQWLPTHPMQAPLGQTGPAALVAVASGVAAGLGWMRRRRRR